MKTNENIAELLGKKVSFYLDHVCEKITKDELQTRAKIVLIRCLPTATEIHKLSEALPNYTATETSQAQDIYLDNKITIA